MEQVFTGNIFIFHAFDVGDDINLEAIKEKQLLLEDHYFYQNILKIIIPHLQ